MLRKPVTYREIDKDLRKVRQEIAEAVKARDKILLRAIIMHLDECFAALAQWFLRQQPDAMIDFQLDDLKTCIVELRWEAVLAVEKIDSSDISL